MSLTLHLGVFDVPEPEGKTTGEVGMELEEKYGLFSEFYKNNENKIALYLEDSVADAVASAVSGNPIPDPFGDATGLIDKRFKEFISLQEVEGLGIPGVPTKAALAGLTLRTRSGKRIRGVKKGQEYKQIRGDRRPSFIYSGVLEASLKSWVD